MNEIFTPGEGYTQYNPEQIQYLRNVSYNKNIIETTKETLAETISIQNQKEGEEEGEYILGLA